MRMHNLLRMFTLTGIGLLISISNNASAQFPTFDISAIKEGITSNIELVKQSKIVTDATATAGKINAGIGDAKGSMSKFAGDNLAKAQEKAEKLKKEKERIEEKKKKYDEYKAEVEAKKKEMEEAKARIEAAKAEVNDAKDMASSAKDLASSAVSDAKGTVQSKVSDAKSQAGVSPESSTASAAPSSQVSVAVPNSDNKNYEPMVQEMQPQIERIPSTVYEQEELPQIMEEAPIATDAENTDELEGKELAVQEERDALDHEMAELEVDAMMAQTPEEKAAVEEKKKELQERIDAFEAKNAAPEKAAAEALTADGSAKADAAPMGRRPFGTQALKVNVEAKAELKADGQGQEIPKRAKILDGETSSDASIEPQAFHRAKILDGDTSTKMEVPESHRPKILDEYKQQQQKAPAAGGFRKRAVPMKSSSLENGMERQFARSFNETLVFAAAGMDEMPDGTQDGVFIVADRMARECEINVKDLDDQKVMDDCIKKLVALKSSKDSAIAQEGNAVYRSIMQETVNALTAESMAQKNIAATYEEKVLEKLEKDIANTKNSRDDTGSLAMTNKELQYLLNRILTIYSSQLSLNALQQIGGFDSSYYSQDGTVTDTADGEK